MIHKSIQDREKRTDKDWGSFGISKIKPYSNNEKDFGNLGYIDFMKEMEKLMGLIYPLIQDGGYVVWIVKDYRDVSNRMPYVPFHSDIAECGRRVGFLWHDLIIWDQS